VGGVEAGPAEIGQPFLEFRQEWVCGRAWGCLGEQVPPLPVCVGVGGTELSVELLLPDSGGVTELGWPGGSQVAWVDLGSGPPYLYVGDQLGWHQGVRLGCPGWRFTFGAEADLVGELSHQL
jgi:hypothetical protein